jgi:hypothetical protein
MVQELLPILPQALTTTQAAVCVALIVAGAFLWLVGAAWARVLVTLLAVALGGTLGMLVPRWQLWPINSMAAAVLGAVCFGVSAFLVERVWCGFVLGVVLVAWTTLGVWMNFGVGEPPIPQRTQWEVASMTPPQHARDLFERMPETVQRVLPFAAATAMVSAMALALLWPRLAKVSAFSLLGVTMLFAGALTLTASRRPDWLKLVPDQVSIQAAVLAVLALLGVVVQWQLLPAKDAAAGEEEEAREAKRQQPSTSAISRGKFV